ncbi:MAG TPA: efflux RND transporter permease subunit [Bacillota bacterium]|nr:efflux RND transporter permease subunit [Bacillota bacterium]HPV12833.1 efflux RND transporter permease subunit [Bacillota bacterium]HPZ77390.1 efflux RND transporter permease subunit [Bacillota bacterium]HQD73795.1 efflux RND transporter permease subunit [Bacillota bacterium]
MNLARTSIKRPVGVLMVMLIVILLGAVSLTELNLDLLPQITPPVAAVITTFRGASANEVCELVTERIEAAVVTTSGIKDLMSISQEGISIVVLTFDWNQDMAEARTDINQKIELVPLPEGASKPTVMKFDPTMLPVMEISITHTKETDLPELTMLSEKTLKPRIEGIEGVASVDMLGGLTQQIQVQLDPAKLNALGLTQDAIAGIIAASNLNYPVGKVDKDGFLLDVRLEGKFKSIEDVEDLVVGYAPATLLTSGVAGLPNPAPAGAQLPGAVQQVPMVPVKLKDVALVEQAFTDITSIARINGKSSVLLSVKKEGSANTVSVAREVRDELDKLKAEISGFDAIISFDQAKFIEESIRSVANNLLLGAVLAIIVLILFLKDFRTTIVIAISIPFSVIATFMLMYFGSLTLNIMTLGGLTLGIGMLVDNSIVVIENIYRHLELGIEPKEAAAKGAGQVATAITASTLTTLVVFLPIVFVGGVSGIIFKELALTVTFSLLASLVVALTVVPMLASVWFTNKKKHGAAVAHASTGNTQPSSNGENQPGRYYKMVEWTLHNRLLVIVLVVALVAVSAYMGSQIGTEFMPTADEGGFSITVTMPEGTPIEKMDKLVLEIEDILDKNPAIQMYTASISAGAGITTLLTSEGGTVATLTAVVTQETLDKKETIKVMEEVEREVDKIRDSAKISFTPQSTIALMAGGISGSVQLSVTGPDIAEVSRINDAVVEKIEQLDEVKEVTSTLTERKPQIHVIVNKEKAIVHGLTPAQIGTALSRAVSGQTVSRLEQDGETFDIVVRYKKDALQTVEDLESLLLSGARGPVPLSEIAEVIDGEGPITINRLNQRTSATIRAKYADLTLGEITAKIADTISDIDVPDGYSIDIGGMSELMEEGFDALKLALVLAIILVYMVMAASFESLATPFVILLTMPLGIVGVVIALYIAGYAFGITAFMGAIVLAGIIVNNGIVMVDFINQERAEGIPLGEAICGGASKRLRAVLMTSLTTILALIPMAIGLGEGGELVAPMALSIMGGLASGTLFTLFVVPVIYSIFTGYRPPVREEAEVEQE